MVALLKFFYNWLGADLQVVASRISTITENKVTKMPFVEDGLGEIFWHNNGEICAKAHMDKMEAAKFCDDEGRIYPDRESFSEIILLIVVLNISISKKYAPRSYCDILSVTKETVCW